MSGTDDTTTRPSWEPPPAGTEAEQLVAAIDRQRAGFRWKVDGLDADGLAQRVGASSLTLGGLLNHLTFVEGLFTTTRLDGSAPGERWAGLKEPAGWEAHFHPEDAPAELFERYDSAVAHAREVTSRAIAEGGLDQHVPADGPQTLRRVLLDLLEAYGRHTGHADLLREAVDGRVGVNPPDEWVSPWDRG